MSILDFIVLVVELIQLAEVLSHIRQKNAIRFCAFQVEDQVLNPLYCFLRWIAHELSKIPH